MSFRQLLLLTATVTALAAQQSSAVIANLDSADWTREKGDPPGSESVVLREDSASGGIELLVRYPSGHTIKPHWHEANERIIVLEGELTLRRDSGESKIRAGGFAFLPAREMQRMSCSSKTRCTFYLAWDGKPRSHSE